MLSASNRAPALRLKYAEFFISARLCRLSSVGADNDAGAIKNTYVDDDLA